jgi:hypothetical protein
VCEESLVASGSGIHSTFVISFGTTQVAARACLALDTWSFDNAAVRLRTPSLAKMFSRCLRTVVGWIHSSRAISGVGQSVLDASHHVALARGQHAPHEGRSLSGAEPSPARLDDQRRAVARDHERPARARVPVGDPFGDSGNGHLEIVPQDPPRLGCGLDPPEPSRRRVPFSSPSIADSAARRHRRMASCFIDPSRIDTTKSASVTI